MVNFYDLFFFVFPPSFFILHRYQKNIMFVFYANILSGQSLKFPKTFHPANTSLSYASSTSMDPLTQGL